MSQTTEFNVVVKMKPKMLYDPLSKIVSNVVHMNDKLVYYTCIFMN